MKRPLLWIVALAIAVAPALAGVCRFDCERARQPECPLHHQAPHPCAHDHTIGAATLTRAVAATPRPADAAIPVPGSRAASVPLVIVQTRADRPHAPPPRSPRIDVLRI